MKKSLEPSFLTWDIFCGGSRHPRKLRAKFQFCYFFFPTNHDSQRSAPGLICAFMFKRIVWKDSTAVAVTLNAYICLQGGGGLKNRS